MQYWLFKSEPFKWSWDQMVAAGEAGTCWDGVRNHLAKKHLQAMQPGDYGFFYHSNEGLAIVGTVEVIRPYYPDPSDASGVFVMVDVRARAPLSRPVTLREIKSDPALADMALVTSALPFPSSR